MYQNSKSLASSFCSGPKMVSFLQLAAEKKTPFLGKKISPSYFVTALSANQDQSHTSSSSLPSFGFDYPPLDSANFSVQTEVKLSMLQHSKENFLIPHSRLFSLLFAHQKNPKNPNSFFCLLVFCFGVRYLLANISGNTVKVIHIPSTL